MLFQPCAKKMGQTVNKLNMKLSIKVLGILFLFATCSGPEVTILCFTQNCDIPATVRHLRNLDGCSYGFELSDGSIIIPERRTYVTAPKIEDDPIYYFKFVDGASVKVGFVINETIVNTCMSGKVAFIKCIQADYQKQ